MAKKRVRIRDIAEAAGVSRGTVDRVIHRRGKVARDVKIKVDRAIKTLGYSPNLFARTLARNNIYNIATLIPDPIHDVFWELPQFGIRKAYEATRDFGINIEPFYFKMNDPIHFREEARKLISSKPDGVLIATEFYREAMDFYKEIEPMNIPVVSINTHLKEMTEASYIGQHSYMSGKLAGKLFDISLQGSAELLILYLGPSADNAKHFMDKEQGVLDYFEDHPSDIKIIRKEFDILANPSEFEPFVNCIFKQNPNINGIFVTNSRTHRLMPVLQKLRNPYDLCIVGFDLIEPNCELLRQGKINFLINQDPIKQGNLGILKLVDSLVFGKYENSINYLPLDIVVEENLDTYTETYRINAAAP